MERKSCVSCGSEKDIAEFYACDKKCKECRRAFVRLHRINNQQKIQEYERSRANKPHRVEAREKYRATENGAARVQKAKDEWVRRNVREHKAHIVVGNALRDGRLLKTCCVICGEVKVEAHHYDYDKPLCVTWLCVPHHKQLHYEHDRY